MDREEDSMAKEREYPMEAGWELLLRDIGVEPLAVLRRAGLSEMLLVEEKAALPLDDYFRFWSSLEEEVNDPLLPLRMIDALSPEAFSPPLFAALCSRHMASAAERLSTYKRLIAPMRLGVSWEGEALSLSMEWLDARVVPPVSMVVTEVIFLVKLVRMATRSRVIPLRITMKRPPKEIDAYYDWLGVAIEKGEENRLWLRREDAERPFLTANDSMWKIFEPSLRKRLADLEVSTTMGERVRAILLEALPGGMATIEEVARRLAMGKRTLQRRLKQEDETFQNILNATREELARHYLTNTTVSSAEISFLLGFDEPSSFFRAFHHWTGQTPEQVRQM